MEYEPKSRRTTSEAEIRSLVGQGLNFPEIAERLNVNVHMLRACCSLLGIRSAASRGCNRTMQDKQAAAERLHGWVGRLERGDSINDIARDEGCSRENVNAQLRRHGLPSSVRAAVKAKHAAVAQSVEQAPCSGLVAGSIPAGGTNTVGG